MNSNNACDNSCYRVCNLWVFWAVCCAELLTCSVELPPQSSHSDRYSGSLVLSPRAKLKILGKTVEQHELQDYSLCTILFATKMLDTNREKLKKNFNFLLILTLYRVCLVGFVKNTCCLLGDCSSSCRSFASFTSPTQPQAAPHIHEIESRNSCRI